MTESSTDEAHPCLQGADYKIEEHVGFGGVPPRVWEALNASGGLCTSHRFMSALEAVEPEPGKSLRLLAARDVGSGALDDVTAVLPFFEVSGCDEGPYGTDALVRGILPEAPPRPSGHSVLLGARAGYDNRVMVSPESSVEQRRHAFRSLFDAATQPLGGARAQTWSMPYLDTASALEFQAAVPDLGVVALSAADAVIDVPDGGLAAYVEALPQKRRTTVRREIRRFAESGCHTELARLSDVYGELSDLLARRLRKYGKEPDEAELERVFSGYAHAYGDDVRVLLARSQNRAVAYVTLYQWKDALYARSWGCESDQARDAALYFNLVYYEPLRLAPKLGARSLHLGPLSYRAKVLRGARLEPRWTVVHRDDLDRNAFAKAAARWNRDQLSMFGDLTDVPWALSAASLLGERSGVDPL